MTDLSFERVDSSMSINAFYDTVSRNFTKYSSLLREIKRLTNAQNAGTLPVIEKSKEPTVNKDSVVTTPLEKSDDKLEKLVLEYMPLLNSCDSYEQLCEVVELIRSEDYRQKAILLRIIANLVRDCHELELILRTLPDDDKQEYEKVLAWERLKIELLSSKLDEKEEIFEDEEDTKQNLIIYNPLLKGSPVYAELDDIDSNYYPMFAHLLELIETHGTDTRCKYICRLPHFKTIGCLYEAKSQAGGRVIFRALDNNNVLILSAFIKKCTSSKAYNESMNAIAEECSQVESRIKEVLNDPCFISQNSREVENLWALLKPMQDVEKEKPPVYVNTKGGDKVCQ